MCDAVAVAEPERGGELLEVPPRRRLRQRAAAEDLGEELAAGSELDDQVDLRLGGHDLVDLQYVRVVVEAAHGGDLANDAGLHGRVDGFGFVDDFHGDGGAVGEGLRLVDLGEAAAAQEAGELVLPEDDGGPRRRPRRRCRLQRRFHGFLAKSVNTHGTESVVCEELGLIEKERWFMTERK